MDDKLKTIDEPKFTAWEEVLASQTEAFRKAYWSHVDSLMAEVKANRKERDELQKQVNAMLKKGRAK